MDADVLRSTALSAACAAFVTVPNLGALLGEGENVERYGTVITPPDYAFAVWGPIFAGCVADTALQCRAHRRRLPSSRRTGWPLAGAYALNALWSIASQRDHFELTPLLLPAATGLTALAHRRLQSLSDPAFTTDVSTGALLGWTSLASTVNIAAGAQLAGAFRSSPRTVATATAGLLGTAGALVATISTSRRGPGAIATTAGWGLLTLAATGGKPIPVRLAAGLGAAAVVVTASRSHTRTRPR